jgi:excisionase family DNA binding protein
MLQRKRDQPLLVQRQGDLAKDLAAFVIDRQAQASYPGRSNITAVSLDTCKCTWSDKASVVSRTSLPAMSGDTCCIWQNVAAILGVSISTVRRWVRGGMLPAKRIGRLWFVYGGDLMPKRFAEDSDVDIP